jgi:hypothetical protein
MGAVRLPPGLVSAILVRRLNRFAVEVELEGKRAQAHLANSGRLQELMLPGAPVLLVPKDAPGRKTAYDLALVCRDGLWVSADARLPNALFREALAQGRLAEFAGCRVARAEVVYGGTRLDFLLEGLQGPLLVETKSVTLVEEGVGLFPTPPPSGAVATWRPWPRRLRRAWGRRWCSWCSGPTPAPSPPTARPTPASLGPWPRPPWPGCGCWPTAVAWTPGK